MNNIVELVFTKLQRSFQVNILNLESLDVKTIQQLEHFVKVRNGIFDFELYRFEIQKNIDIYEFKALMSYAGIECLCSERLIYQDESPRIEFGQYKGMFFSDLDDAYILWLKSNYRGSQKKILDTEVEKRDL